MKIYNEVVIDIATGKTLSEDSYEYNGPMMLLQGDETDPSTWSSDFIVYTTSTDPGNAPDYYAVWQYDSDAGSWSQTGWQEGEGEGMSEDEAYQYYLDGMIDYDTYQEYIQTPPGSNPPSGAPFVGDPRVMQGGNISPGDLGFSQWSVSTGIEWQNFGDAPMGKIGPSGGVGEASLEELAGSLETEEWMTGAPGTTVSGLGDEALEPFPSGDLKETDPYLTSPFITGYEDPLKQYLDVTFGGTLGAPEGSTWGEDVTTGTTGAELMEKVWGKLGVDPEYRSYGEITEDIPGGGDISAYWSQPQLGVLGEQLRGAFTSPELLQGTGGLGDIATTYTEEEQAASQAFLPGGTQATAYSGAYDTAAIDEQDALDLIQDTRDVSAEEARNIYEDMRLRGLVGEEGSLQVGLETELAGLEQTAEAALGGPGGYLSTMGAEELGWEEKMAGWETKLDVGQTDKERRMDLIKEEANVGSQKASEGLLGVRLSELAESYARGGAKFGAPVSVAEQDIREQRVLELKGYATERGISGENWSTMLEEYGFEETDDGIAPIITDDGGYVPGSIIGLAAGAREAEEQGALQTALSALSTGGYTAEGYGTDLESLYAYLTADDADWTAEQIAELIQPMGWDPITQQYSGEVSGDVALALGGYQSTLESEQAGQLAAMRQLGGYWDPVTQEFVEYGEFSSDGTEGGPSYEFTDPVTGLPASMTVGFPEGGWGAAEIGDAVLESRGLQEELYGMYSGGTLEAPIGGTLGNLSTEVGLWQAPGQPEGPWALTQEGRQQQAARQDLSAGWETALSGLTSTGTSLGEEWHGLADPSLGGWLSGSGGAGGFQQSWLDLWESINA